MKISLTTGYLFVICTVGIFTSVTKSEPKPDDEFSLGYVTKENYKKLDWKSLRGAARPNIQKGAIEGFLSVKQTSKDSFNIYLYETLEALELNRPRQSIQIASDIFRNGLSLSMRQKKIGLLDKKWVRIFGIFEVVDKKGNWPLADTVRCDSIEWRNDKGELVRSLD